MPDVTNAPLAAPLLVAAGLVVGAALGFWVRGLSTPKQKESPPHFVASDEKAAALPEAPSAPSTPVVVPPLPGAAGVSTVSVNDDAPMTPVRLTEQIENARAAHPDLSPHAPLLLWLMEWAQQLSDVRKELDKWDTVKTPSGAGVPPDLPPTDVLVQILRALYQPQMPRTLPPPHNKEEWDLLPLINAAFACAAGLDTEMRRVLRAEPLLPLPGTPFDSQSHDALSAYRRVARPEETPGNIYSLLSPGLQSAGRVILQAEVGLLDTPRPSGEA